MSKKMLKKSLALGALMAMVITGSAFAQDVNATTLGGYGITDAYTKTEVDTKIENNNETIRGEINTAIDNNNKANNTSILAEVNKAIDDNNKVNNANILSAVNTAIDDNNKVNNANLINVMNQKDNAVKTELEGKLTVEEQARIAGDKANAQAISGLNQRLGSLNGKINKVGAGAAALAALHPLDYDPDDKLTFSAGMGNYAGENAAALGAFYRPNEKFMVSLGGTMGNGENMVNLGLSIGLDKPNGLAKLSKRELIQKVNAVEAENDALEDRVAKLEALVAQLASK